MIIVELSVNGSVQFLGLSDQVWGSGLPYIAKLRAQVEATGLSSSNNSNQSWGARFNDDNIITNLALGAYIYACTD